MKGWHGLRLAAAAYSGLALVGCAAPIVTTAPPGCSALLPASWSEGIPGVDLPGEDATAGDLWVAFDGQTGRLDSANGRTKDAIDIVTRCEARDAAAVKKATAPWWKRPFL